MNLHPRRHVLAIVAPLAVLVLAACQPPPVIIPNGAQVVRVTTTEDAAMLAPRTVQNGDVYFVIEGPGLGFTFVSHRAEGDAEPSGMTEAQIERIRRGDYQDTQIEGFAVSCAPEAWTEASRWEGCRENSMLTLTEGLYAVLANSEEPGAPPVMDVLEVVP